MKSHAPATTAQQPGLSNPIAQAADSFQAIGPLFLGMTQAQADLGQITTETPAQLSQSTGLCTKDWLYPEKGIGFSLEAEEATGTYKVASILPEEPCQLQAVSGIAIGTAKSDAERCLKALMGEDVEWFGGDTVKQIYLGPGPE